MGVVVKCVKRIGREFRGFLEDLEEEYSVFLLHCEVRRLSKGEVLSYFCLLKNSVLQFSEEKGELPGERELLLNNVWLRDLAFLTDITGHLNTLNMNLQGSNKLLTNLATDVTSIKLKLKLFVTQRA